MSCDACKCLINHTYQLTSSHCECGNDIPEAYGTYIGMSDGVHHFRLRHVYCPVCRQYKKYSHVPCKDFDGIDVTEEFEKVKDEFAWLDVIQRKNGSWDE